MMTMVLHFLDSIKNDNSLYKISKKYVISVPIIFETW